MYIFLEVAVQILQSETTNVEDPRRTFMCNSVQLTEVGPLFEVEFLGIEFRIVSKFFEKA